MRIGIDVDGVAADLHTPWLVRLSARIGRTVTPDDMTQWAFWDDFGVTAELVWELYTSDIYDVVNPYADVESSLRAIAEAGHTIVYVTQSRDQSFYAAKRDWLYRHGLVFGTHTEIHAVGRWAEFKTKGDPRLKLDWLVDDTIENLEDARTAGVYGILKTLPHNRREISRFARAKTLSEVVTMLKYHASPEELRKPAGSTLDEINDSYNYGAEHCGLVGTSGRGCVIGSPASVLIPPPGVGDTLPPFKAAESPLPTEASERKAVPMVTGLLDYFPAALAEVAKISVAGNKQHFVPGTPLHWDRKRSTDHADSAVRHLMDRGGFDTDNVRHSAKAAWRTLANLQEELEAAGAPASRASRF